MTFTKANIVETVAEQNGYPKNQSFEMIETLLEIIKRTLESGDDVLVSGFGKFCEKEKARETGKEPFSRREYDAGTEKRCDIRLLPQVEK